MKDCKNEISENVLRLLRSNEHDPVAASCLALISDGHEVRQRSLSNSLPIENVIDIYTVRETLTLSI